jgi:hypothetical protein
MHFAPASSGPIERWGKRLEIRGAGAGILGRFAIPRSRDYSFASTTPTAEVSTIIAPTATPIFLSLFISSSSCW